MSESNAIVYNVLRGAAPLGAHFDWISRIIRNVPRTQWHPDIFDIAEENKVYDVLSDAGMLEKVESYLAKTGVGELHYYAHGGNALVFKMNDCRLIRFCTKEHTSDIEADEVLKPFLTQSFEHGGKGVRLEVLPELDTKAVEQRHVDALSASLWRRNLFFADNRIANVGLLPDGTPVVIDRGAVRPADARDKEALSKEVKALLLQPPRYDWRGKQEKFFPEVRTGRIAGAPGEEEPSRNAAWRIREERGHYPDLLDALGRDAEKQFASKADRRDNDRATYTAR